jgi:hypothetical protein
MKTTLFLSLLLASRVLAQTGDFEVVSLASNGRLVFTNSFPNGLYTIQWAPKVPHTNWLESWTGLTAFPVTGNTGVVEVPMFYRVKCMTNLFIPTATGRQFVYALPGATATLTFLGPLKLSSDLEYTILEYRLPTEIKLLPCRATPSEFYTIPFESKEEVLEWRSGPSGTTWTNYYGDGSSDQMKIASNESVTVPAGTFDCVKIEQREINVGNLRLRGVQWIKPGFMMVKNVDYGDGSGQPITISLVSWSDTAAR